MILDHAKFELAGFQEIFLRFRNRQTSAVFSPEMGLIARLAHPKSAIMQNFDREVEFALAITTAIAYFRCGYRLPLPFASARFV